VALADVFDALTHSRPYKPACSSDEAVAEVCRLTGRQFDPAVVQAFLGLDADSLVELPAPRCIRPLPPRQNGAMTILAGRYRLEGVIGRGGMSTVYRASDRVLQRTVAVKVMSPALAEDDPSYVTRFEREARAAASLSHPGIVTVYDTGVDEEMRFIAMEFVDGETLTQLIHREAPLDPDRAAWIAAEVADALEAAHQAGLVHRDVKPGNVMIARDGSVKVLDFGIARALDSATITKTGSMLGAMPYMPPEHARGEPIDARSDLYSLGCVLYEMLTGARPFRDVTTAIFQQQRGAGPRPPREANPQVGRELSALVLQMLARAPAKRPQSAAEVRDRLRGAPAPPVGAAPTPAPGGGEEGTSATRVIGETGPAAGPLAGGGARRGGAWLRFAAGLLIVAVVALIAVLALASGSSNPTQSTSTAGSTTSSTTPTTTSTTRTTPAQSGTTTPTQTVTVTTTATAPAGGGGGAGPGATAPGPGGGPPGHAGKHKKHGGGD
jgi:serine/threonine-protein kinase